MWRKLCDFMSSKTGGAAIEMDAEAVSQCEQCIIVLESVVAEVLY